LQKHDDSVARVVLEQHDEAAAIGKSGEACLRRRGVIVFFSSTLHRRQSFVLFPPRHNIIDDC
jgi:hypothetical protein